MEVQSKNKKTELLAPAGSFETMKGAFLAGADAVYMGGEKFGARAYAKNAKDEVLLEAIDYAHLRDKKFYLTVNTLLKEQELESELYRYLAPLYEEGLDAVIVQDMGVLSFIKKEFPLLSLHASTQMTVTGERGARLLQEIGCTRVVPARELTLAQLAQIRENTDLEIESFVHGALCYCYSGQCLISSFFGGRSGNRGRCAQPCRLPYDVYGDGRQINNDRSSFVLSPKDMCTVEILPEIIRAGVTSLKIEGRMKKPEYTAGVVRIYRKYLDLYTENPKRYTVGKEDLQELFDLYNRDGFHRGYYEGQKGPHMMALKNEKQSLQWNTRNEALFEEIQETCLKREDTIPVKGVLTIKQGRPVVLKVAGKQAELGLAETAKSQPLTEEKVREQVMKTGNTPYRFTDLQICMGDGLFVPVQTLKEVRRTALDLVKSAKLAPHRRTLPEKAEEKEPVPPCKEAGPLERLQVSVETKEQLLAALASPFVDKIYGAFSVFFGGEAENSIENFIGESKKAGKRPYLALPHVVNHGDLDFVKGNFKRYLSLGLSGYLVRNLESLALLKEENLLAHATIDANLYTYNQEARNFYRSLGILMDTAPLELNSTELAVRGGKDSELIIYGYVPLMVSAQCVKKNLSKCTKNSEVLTLQDRYKKKFCVKCVCDFCYNIIYNSVPLALWKEAEAVRRLGFSGLRLCFTTECEKEMKAVLEGYASVFIKGESVEDLCLEYTKGHFKRGVL